MIKTAKSLLCRNDKKTFSTNQRSSLRTRLEKFVHILLPTLVAYLQPLFKEFLIQILLFDLSCFNFLTPVY